MKMLLLIIILMATMPIALSYQAETSSYTINSTQSGLAGGEPTTSNYSFVYTATYQQGTENNVTTATYSFNSGWLDFRSYPAILVTEEAPSQGGGGGGGGSWFDCSVYVKSNKRCYHLANFNACVAGCEGDKVCTPDFKCIDKVFEPILPPSEVATLSVVTGLWARISNFLFPQINIMAAIIPTESAENILEVEEQNKMTWGKLREVVEINFNLTIIVAVFALLLFYLVMRLSKAYFGGAVSSALAIVAILALAFFYILWLRGTL